MLFPSGFVSFDLLDEGCRVAGREERLLRFWSSRPIAEGRFAWDCGNSASLGSKKINCYGYNIGRRHISNHSLVHEY